MPARTRSPTFTTGRFPHHSVVIKMVRAASVLCGTSYRYHCFTLTPNEGSGSSASTCDSISAIWRVLWNDFCCAKIDQFQIKSHRDAMLMHLVIQQRSLYKMTTFEKNSYSKHWSYEWIKSAVLPWTTFTHFPCFRFYSINHNKIIVIQKYFNKRLWRLK